MQTAMQTTIETLGQLERRLNVAVPRAQIEGEVEKRLARLAKTVKLPGFRPGKVPLKMVVQQYGQSVRSDVISDAVQTSFNDAIREQNLRVAGTPRIEPRDAKTTDQFEFSALFEIYPEVTLGELSTMKVERPVAVVGPDDVDRTLEILRRQRVRYDAVTRPAQQGGKSQAGQSEGIQGVAFLHRESRPNTKPNRTNRPQR